MLSVELILHIFIFTVFLTAVTLGFSWISFSSPALGYLRWLWRSLLFWSKNLSSGSHSILCSWIWSHLGTFPHRKPELTILHWKRYTFLELRKYVVGFSYFNNNWEFFRLKLKIFDVVEYFLARVGMELIVFCFEVEQTGDIDSLRVYGFGVGSWGVMREPGPIVVALADV